MSARRWLRLAARLIGRESFEPVEIGASVVVSSDGSLLLLRRLPGLASRGRRRARSVRFRSCCPAGPNSRGPAARSTPIDAPSDGASSEVASRLDQAIAAEVVDFDQVAGPLFVRAPLPGDRFDPLGMEGKSNGAGRLFSRAAGGSRERARTPLVCDQRGIVWVAGHRIAERVKETSHTERRLRLSMLAMPAG